MTWNYWQTRCRNGQRLPFPQPTGEGGVMEKVTDKMLSEWIKEVKSICDSHGDALHEQTLARYVADKIITQQRHGAKGE